MLSLALLLELTYWAPLLALVLLSLGLVALKRISRLPPWIERLSAPPFYLVSLPIATLLVGLDVLAWMVLLAYMYADWVELTYLPAITFVLIWIGFPAHPLESLIAGISFIEFCAAPFVSGYLLRRTLRNKNELEYPSNKMKQHLRALLLLLAFVWTFLIMRFLVLSVAGSGSLSLRIV